MWVSKEVAKHCGMTHEGTLYGVKVFLKLGRDIEFDAVAKFLPATMWIAMCDLLYELTSYCMPADATLVTPMTIGAEL